MICIALALPILPSSSSAFAVAFVSVGASGLRLRGGMLTCWVCNSL